VEPNRLQHEDSAASLVGQQYSSPTGVSVRFPFVHVKRIFGALFKNVISALLPFENCTSEIA
jgi:hypothetical protein